MSAVTRFPDDHPITISVGAGKFDNRPKNVAMTVAGFEEGLCKPPKQSEKKDKQRWFIGGASDLLAAPDTAREDGSTKKGGWRSAKNYAERQVVSLDIDFISREDLYAIVDGTGALAGARVCGYSSYSATEDKLKCRVNLYASRPLTRVEYADVVTELIEDFARVAPSAQVDRASCKHSQVMYFGRRAPSSDTFFWWRTQGGAVDVESIVETARAKREVQPKSSTKPTAGGSNASVFNERAAEVLLALGCDLTQEGDEWRGDDLLAPGHHIKVLASGCVWSVHRDKGMSAVDYASTVRGKDVGATLAWLEEALGVESQWELGEVESTEADRVVASAKAVGKDGGSAKKGAVLTAWAALPKADRVLTRKQVATALGVRMEDMPRPDGAEEDPDEDRLVHTHTACDDAQHGPTLANEIAAHLSEFMFLPPHAADVLALLVITSHAVVEGAFQTAPYLYVRSPQPRCGKSTLMEILAMMMARSLSVSASITPAVLFRAIAAARPSMLVDEADKVFQNAKDNPDLIGCINTGNRRGASIMRCVGDEYEVKAFDCFAIYVMAGIGSHPPPGTILDRSIVVSLERKPTTTKVSRRPRSWREDAHEFGTRAAKWVADNGSNLPELAENAPRPAFLDDRAADTWEALFAVAKRIGGDWPARAWDAAKALSGYRDEEREMPPAVAILRDCHTVFWSGMDGEPLETPAPRLSTKELLAGLEIVPESPWAEWNHGRGLNDRGLARLLGKDGYGILSKKLKFGCVPLMGYEYTAFQPAWDSYLADAEEVDDGDDEWSRWTDSAPSPSAPPSSRNCGTSAKNGGKVGSGSHFAGTPPGTPKHRETSQSSAVPDNPEESGVAGVSPADEAGNGEYLDL